MRKYNWIWWLLLVSLLAACSLSVEQSSAIKQKLPTPTLHPFFSAEKNLVESELDETSQSFSTLPAELTPKPTVEVTPSPSATVTTDAVQTPSTSEDNDETLPTPDAAEVGDTTSIQPGESTLEVPVLTYYHIIDEVGGPVTDFTKEHLDTERFRQQMTYLAENEFTPIDFYDLSRALEGDQELPPKPIILTFFEGYTDNYENAFPILEEFEFVGTFFIPTELVEFSRDDYMTWEMIEEMAAAGHRFEPHSITHSDLRGQERDYLMWQILGSQEILSDHIDYTPRFFAYPDGKYDADVIQLLTELDFWGALTEDSGNSFSLQQRYEWPRLYVPADTSQDEFTNLVVAGAPVDVQRRASASGILSQFPSLIGQDTVAPIRPTDTITITVYDDSLNPNWILRTSPGARYQIQDDSTTTHSGGYTLSFTPQEDFSSLYFQVRLDAPDQYPRNRVLKVSFWLLSDETIEPNDLAIAISGSKDFPFWVANDDSVDLQTYDPIFDLTGTYLLDLGQAIEPNTWTQVEVTLDDLEYDTDYNYVTGIHIKNNVFLDKSIYLDQIELIMLANEPE